MNVVTDRTYEIEQRMRAIRIGTQDGCAFFKLRESSLVNMRQCWYCAYSQFDWENSDIYQQGLCKFKWQDYPENGI